MSYSGYVGPNMAVNSLNGADVNFNKNPTMFPDAYGKIEGVGCAGDKMGVNATKSVYVDDQFGPKAGMIVGGRGRSKRSKLNKRYAGGSAGYTFSNPNNNPIQIASPYSLYPVINTYNNGDGFKEPFFPQQFKSTLPGVERLADGQLTRGKYMAGGKRTKKVIYKQRGCSKKGRTCYGGTKKHYRKRGRKCGGSMRLQRRGGGRRKRSCKMRNHKMCSHTMRGGSGNSVSDYTVGRNATLDQPYSNQAISFGQGLMSYLGPNESGLASPTPLLPYNDCGRYTRN
jgi:hypothetical protein